MSHLVMAITAITKKMVMLEMAIGAPLQGGDLLPLPLLVLQCTITRYRYVTFHVSLIPSN